MGSEIFAMCLEISAWVSMMFDRGVNQHPPWVSRLSNIDIDTNDSSKGVFHDAVRVHGRHLRCGDASPRAGAFGKAMRKSFNNDTYSS